MAFTYEIVKKIATIAETGGNSVELNIIRYGNKAPKYDLRRWRVKECRKVSRWTKKNCIYCAMCLMEWVPICEAILWLLFDF